MKLGNLALASPLSALAAPRGASPLPRWRRRRPAAAPTPNKGDTAWMLTRRRSSC